MSQRLAFAGFFCLLALAMANRGSAAILVHDYQLNGSLADSQGGPALVSLGGTTGASRYTFGTNQGLRLTGGLVNTSNYSIEFRSEYDSLIPFWKKMVDFQNLGSDTGLYIGGDRLTFFNDTSAGAMPVIANADFHFVLTRNSATGITTGYVDGIQQWTFTGTNSISGPNILTFFRDDNVTGGSENTSGSVDFIRIYDGALTGSEAAFLAGGGSLNPVPEPATCITFAGLALCLGVGALRRKRLPTP